MTSRSRIVGGQILLAALVVLGLAARSATLTSADISLNEHVAAWRDPALTTLAKAATFAAQAAVGVAAALLLPAVLWLLRRRQDAVRVLFTLGGAMAIGYAVKIAVSEKRPPQRLWVIAPDSVQSFPSGHTTIAVALAVSLVLLVGSSLRLPAILVGMAFAATVAGARVYLGVHYLPDVIGGLLAATSAALLVSGVMQLPVARRHLDTLERGGPAHAAHANGSHISVRSAVQR
ncbi:phosphatase PAP2 family protein (plasmid) [Streptomyces mirabilis]|uniref:phosphatase PAP2 family protein n=1 Tax=Streptomyces mirabilis TaxID=68239 RepID=UPI001BAF3F97|nr:phosphatase PAP2 family protein [Streptomyces mirabilis]QUW85710.1 phosphatase PAP2 family protein [Streptomyces mirabilis]